MNPEARAELERITIDYQDNPSAMNPAEAAFLRARRSYLTPSETERFAEILNPQDSAPQNEDLEDMTSEQLKERALELGIDFPGNIKKVDLINLIRDVEQQNA